MPAIDYDSENHLLDRSFLSQSIPELVRQLTIDEKRELLATPGWWHTTPIPRLNIPSIKVTDGPNGARGGSFYNPTPGVAVPCATAVAATFDMDLVEAMGTLLAKETKARGAATLLGPCVNIARSPLGGRAFESPSEDPMLSGHFAAAYVRALQAGGVGACIKHYVCNDQEDDRNGADARVAPRPLREVYLRPFQLALALGPEPAALMASYNAVNGTHVSENKELLDGVLRREWKYGGLVMSDWNGTYSTAEALNAGLNIEFPGPSRWRTKTLFDQTLAVHKITMRTVDANVTRVLEWVQRMAKASPEVVYSQDKTECSRTEAVAEDAKLVRRLGAEGIVLLKNDQELLPLSLSTTPRKVAVIGPLAKAQVFTGGGSARLLTSWGVTPYASLAASAPDGIETAYAPGTSIARWLPLLDDSFTAPSSGTPGFDIYHYPMLPDGTRGTEWLVHDTLTRSEVRYHDFGAPGLEDGYFAELKTTFTAPTTGAYQFGVCITGKGWLWIDDELVWSLTDYRTKGRSFYGSGTDEQYVTIQVEEGKEYHIRLLHDFRAPPNVRHIIPAAFRYGGLRLGAQQVLDPRAALDDAVAIARASDVAVVVAGLGPEWEMEGVDRTSLSLPLATDELIAAVAAANPNTVVVLLAGSAVSMPWVDDVRAIVHAWYGGNEAGNSIADVLYGRVNPSGRLPLTFPRGEADSSAALSRFSQAGKVYYEDGLHVGYKHYNARGIAPLFPFGHGLSYTTFAYADLVIEEVCGTTASEWRLTAAVTVTNTGRTAGSHSVHFYTSPPSRTPPLGLLHPSHSLQAFTKVHDLAPGESRSVSIILDKYAVSHWDETDSLWTAEPGTWGLSVGRDAQTLELCQEFEVISGLEWVGL